jgi:hypothetical protein
MTGKTSASSEDHHCARCFAFLNVALCVVWTASAAVLNVGIAPQRALAFDPRVLALARASPRHDRFVARITERDELHAAQAEIAALALNDAAPNPTLRAAGVHEQIEALAIRVAPWSFRVSDGDRAETLMGMLATGLVSTHGVQVRLVSRE